MAHYYNKICHLHPTAINDEDFRLEDDGTGVKIKNWIRISRNRFVNTQFQC